MHAELKWRPAGTVERHIYWCPIYLHRWFMVASVCPLGCLFICDQHIQKKCLVFIATEGKKAIDLVTRRPFLQRYQAELDPLFSLIHLPCTPVLSERTNSWFGRPCDLCSITTTVLNFQISKPKPIYSACSQKHLLYAHSRNQLEEICETHDRKCIINHLFRRFNPFWWPCDLLPRCKL